jgi:hypothetical protein
MGPLREIMIIFSQAHCASGDIGGTSPELTNVTSLLSAALN